MKTQISKFSGSICAVILGAWCTMAPAQTRVTETTTTTTTSGVIGEYAPGGETIVVRGESGGPGNYYVTRETTFVDEAGTVVAPERIVAGAPITVHYIRDGSRMVASRVVMRRAVSAPVPVAPVTETQRTVTTTTTGTGTFDQFTPGTETVVIRSSAGPQPYLVNSSTVYVDEAGVPIPLQSIGAGTPVTVYFTRDEGQRLIASRFVINRSQSLSPRKLTEDEKEDLKEARKEAREDAKEAREDARERAKEAREEARERAEDARD